MQFKCQITLPMLPPVMLKVIFNLRTQCSKNVSFLKTGVQYLKQIEKTTYNGFLHDGYMAGVVK